MATTIKWETAENMMNIVAYSACQAYIEADADLDLEAIQQYARDTFRGYCEAMGITEVESPEDDYDEDEDFEEDDFEDDDDFDFDDDEEEDDDECEVEAELSDITIMAGMLAGALECREWNTNDPEEMELLMKTVVDATIRFKKEVLGE